MTFSYTDVLAISVNRVYLRGLSDDEDPNARLSRIVQYREGIWTFEDFPFRTGGMAIYHRKDLREPAICIAGENGDLRYLEPAWSPEKIIDQDAEWHRRYRLGRLTKLRQIGDHLYASGESGQSYIRNDEGKWQPVDLGLFNPIIDYLNWDKEFFPPDAPPYFDKNRYLLDHPELIDRHTQKLMEITADNLIYSINGESEKELYICGKDGLLFTKEQFGNFKRIEIDGEERFLDIAVQSKDVIWICSDSGVLLLGNARSGFRVAPNLGDFPTYRNMAIFQDKLYIASSNNPPGLFLHDGNHLQRIATGLTPEIGPLARISACQDALWAVSHKDLVRYDGKNWERIIPPGVSGIPGRGFN